jgi:hypothetical protein
VISAEAAKTLSIAVREACNLVGVKWGNRQSSRASPPEVPPVDEIAYEQASRALEQQAGVLDELRQRTSTLIAVTAIVATFLGREALNARPEDQGPSIALLLALAALVLGVGACLAVLAPTKMRKRRKELPEPAGSEDVIALNFTMNVEALLDRAEARGPLPDTLRLDVARTLQLHWNENSTIIAAKQRAFRWAVPALFAQTVSWIAFIALGREVI